MGSTRKVEINLGETVKKTKFTPPSLIKATPTIIANDPNDVCPMSFSNADDIMLMSSSQPKEIHSNHSIPPKKDPQQGKITAIISVMRGKPKDGCHRHHSNNEKNCVSKLSMQSNCNGPSILVKQAKKNYGSRRQEAR